VGRVKLTRGVLAGAAARVAVGLAGLVFFLVVVVGGGVYRTDCISSTGQMTRTWGLEGDIPYLWSPGDNRCEAHSLGRYVAGKVGLMGDVDR
jgi:hypothetical protein